MEIKKHTGIFQFGRAYAKMLENDPHPSGTIDRVLLENMVRLTSETRNFLYSSFTPLQVKYEPGTRPELEKYLNEAIRKEERERVVANNIINFCGQIARQGENYCPENLIVGGTEEEIIRRKTDWCTDLARVGCALFQIAGFPARIAYLFNTGKAYSGHAIIEVYWEKNWGAMDPTHGLIYLDFAENPASIVALQDNEDLIVKNEPNPYPEQFQGVAFSNYFIWEAEKYDFTPGVINEYYKKILEMSEKGWPGGLRWLYGEND